MPVSPYALRSWLHFSHRTRPHASTLRMQDGRLRFGFQWREAEGDWKGLEMAVFADLPGSLNTERSILLNRSSISLLSRYLDILIGLGCSEVEVSERPEEPHGGRLVLKGQGMALKVWVSTTPEVEPWWEALDRPAPPGEEVEVGQGLKEAVARLWPVVSYLEPLPRETPVGGAKVREELRYLKSVYVGPAGDRGVLAATDGYVLLTRLLPSTPSDYRLLPPPAVRALARLPASPTVLRYGVWHDGRPYLEAVGEGVRLVAVAPQLRAHYPDLGETLRKLEGPEVARIEVGTGGLEHLLALASDLHGLCILDASDGSVRLSVHGGTNALLGTFGEYPASVWGRARLALQAWYLQRIVQALPSRLVTLRVRGRPEGGPEPYTVWAEAGDWLGVMMLVYLPEQALEWEWEKAHRETEV